MKKLFFTLLAITILSFTASAQTASHKVAIMSVQEGDGILSACAITVYFGENLSKKVDVKCKTLHDSEIAELEEMLNDGWTLNQMTESWQSLNISTTQSAAAVRTYLFMK